MTPPGRSRDGDADNDERREAEPGRSRSRAQGAPPDDAPDDASEGGPDDPKLRAMRAVWLAMRTEDPPDRGLAELLAAARHKAEAMQPRPTAWQRLLAAMRWPPALALATAMVLIASAVLIGRRVTDEMDRSAVSRATAESGSGAASPRPSPSATKESGGVLAQPPPSLAQPAAPGPADTPAMSAPGTRHRPAPVPVLRTPAPRERETTGDDRGAADPQSSTLAVPASDPPPGSAPPLGTSAAVPSFDTAKKVDARKPVAPAAAAAPPVHPAPGDLYQQCEAAALREDCASVRQLVDWISRTDPGYRARIAKDSPVGKCLAE